MYRILFFCLVALTLFAHPSAIIIISNGEADAHFNLTFHGRKWASNIPKYLDQHHIFTKYGKVGAVFVENKNPGVTSGRATLDTAFILATHYRKFLHFGFAHATRTALVHHVMNHYHHQIVIIVWNESQIASLIQEFGFPLPEPFPQQKHSQIFILPTHPSHQQVQPAILLPHTPPGRTLPLLLSNQTGLQDHAVYILIKGISKGKEGFIQLNEEGIGQHSVPPDGSSSLNYCYPLSQLPKVEHSRLLYLPDIQEGKIFFSCHAGVDMLVNKGSINEPNVLNTKDPNYHLFYDKIEIAYSLERSPHVQLQARATDFFCLPIQVTLSPGESAGIAFPREKVFHACVETFDTTWSRLLVPGDPLVPYLRVLHPAQSMKMKKGFPVHYFFQQGVHAFDWIAHVWQDYYKKGNGCLTFDLDDMRLGTFIGYVHGNNNFIFTNSMTHEIITIPQPNSSLPFFDATSPPFDAPTGSSKHAIVKLFAAAVNTGLLPFTPTVAVSGSYFKNLEYQMLYTDNTIHHEYPHSRNHGPWYNVYSKILHAFSKKMTTSSFDDVLGLDGALSTDVNDNTTITITLHPVGTAPNPFISSSDNTIELRIPFGVILTYANKDYPYGVYRLSGVSSPMECIYTTHTGGQYKTLLYLDYPTLRPTFPAAAGFTVLKNSHKNYTIIVPSVTE